MPQKKSSRLSFNQKLTLLIAFLAIVGGVVAAFISGHDWFSPQNTTLSVFAETAISIESPTSAPNTIHPVFTEPPINIESPTSASTKIDLPSTTPESGKFTLTICNHSRAMSDISQERVVIVNNKGVNIEISVPFGKCANIEIAEGFYIVNLLDATQATPSTMNSIKNLIREPTCLLIIDSRLVNVSIDKCASLP
jgi:hypothetical protein